MKEGAIRHKVMMSIVVKISLTILVVSGLVGCGTAHLPVESQSRKNASGENESLKLPGKRGSRPERRHGGWGAVETGYPNPGYYRSN